MTKTLRRLHLCYIGRNSVVQGVVRNDLLHKHEVWSLDLCCEGEIQVQIKNSVLHFKQGDILLIPPGLPHRFMYQGKEFLCFSFKFELLNMPENSITDFCLDDRKEHICIREKIINAVQQCTETFMPEKLWGQSRTFVPPQAIHELQILEDFLFGIVSFYIRQKLSSARQQPADRLRQQIAEYVGSRGGRAVTERELAKHLHYSPRYFRTLVHQCCGQTPKLLIDQIRIQIIEDVLRYSGLRLNEVADNMGFADARYFTRFFKKYTGVSPREWLRRCRNQEQP